MALTLPKILAYMRAGRREERRDRVVRKIEFFCSNAFFSHILFSFFAFFSKIFFFLIVCRFVRLKSENSSERMSKQQFELEVALDFDSRRISPKTWSLFSSVSGSIRASPSESGVQGGFGMHS